VTQKKNSKDAIGKGLRSLLGSIDSELKTPAGTLKTDVVEAATGITRLNVKQIKPNPKQPRKDFDETALQELADSLKKHDLIQPITVHKNADGNFTLISGERRWRAAQLAGLQTIPAYIRQVNDVQLLELALLENLQRENLNAIEVALSYQRMMDELEYTQEKVADRMGKERSTVTNYLRLLKLPPTIQMAVRQSKLSMGHARALINVIEVDRQIYIYKEIENKGLSVRQTEQLVSSLNKTGTLKNTVSKPSLAPAYSKIQDKLSSHFGTKAILKHNKKGYGSITLEYYSLQELNKLLDQFGVTIN
jgi:ParB family transcriptional regulator, chromosome partitioning protein